MIIMSSILVYQIALPVSLGTLFDYLPPSDSENISLLPGTRVLVPFRKKTIIGIFIQTVSLQQLPTYSLKKVLQILDPEPILNKNTLQLILWASSYYHYPIGETFFGVLPSFYAHQKKLPDCSNQWVKLRSNRAPSSSPTPPQKNLLVYLESCQRACSLQELKILGYSYATVLSLIKKGLLTWQDEIPLDVKDSFRHPLNDEQQTALNTIESHLHAFNVYVLEGVTGSGKTEVYLHLVESILKAGKQALILSPEIGLTPQLVERFQQFLGIPVYVYHSGLSDLERLRTYTSALSGAAKVVIGTRSAIFIPFQTLGVIVIDEAHDPSYKQQDRFRYNARDLAIYRGSLLHIPVILGSATPPLESYANILKKKHRHLVLKERAGNSVLPELYFIDMKNQPTQHGISRQLLEIIHQTLDCNEQILLFINRRGYAPSLLCKKCGWTALCTRCDARLTYHLHTNTLRCHHCGYTIKKTDECPQCHEQKLQHAGFGTERVETYLKKALKDTDVLRIDRDTIQTLDQLDAVRQKILEQNKLVLIGTQMLSKGHHFPGLTTVAILNADHGLFGTDFRAFEQLSQQIHQVAGRAGRLEKQGKVYLQTYFPNHPMMLKLIEKNYHDLSLSLLDERKKNHLPPFSNFALLRAESTQKLLPFIFMEHLQQDIEEANKGSSVASIGPIPALIERKQTYYRAILLFQSPSKKSLHTFLNYLEFLLHSKKISKAIRWIIDVDPYEIF